MRTTFLKHCSSTSRVGKCVCMCICVRLHLCMCERPHSTVSPCLFYYSYSCVDPLSAHRHLPETHKAHTAHTDVLAIFSLPPFSLSGALLRLSFNNNLKNTPQQTALDLCIHLHMRFTLNSLAPHLDHLSALIHPHK